jgi:exonuclease VII small subunit
MSDMKRTLATLCIGAALIFGCGESRQEKFERALRDAEAARVGLESAREQVKKSEENYEEARKSAERAEAQLDSARGELDAASERLEVTRAEVLKWAPDGTLPPEMQPLPVPHAASEPAPLD